MDSTGENSSNQGTERVGHPPTEDPHSLVARYVPEGAGKDRPEPAAIGTHTELVGPDEPAEQDATLQLPDEANLPRLPVLPLATAVLSENLPPEVRTAVRRRAVERVLGVYADQIAQDTGDDLQEVVAGLWAALADWYDRVRVRVGSAGRGTPLTPVETDPLAQVIALRYRAQRLADPNQGESSAIQWPRDPDTDEPMTVADDDAGRDLRGTLPEVAEFESRSTVKALIERAGLTDGEEDVVHAVDLGDLSLREAADELDSTYGSVRTLRSKAHKKLRNAAS